MKRFISIGIVLTMSILSFTSVYANDNFSSINQRKILEAETEDLMYGKISKEDLQLKKESVRVPRTLDSSIKNFIKTESDLWSVLSANIPEDSYGGMYIKDGVLHIKTIEPADINIIKNKVNQIEKFISEEVRDEINLLLLEPIEKASTSLLDVDAEYTDSTTNEPIREEMSILKESNSVIVVENDAVYTMEELEKAMDKLWEAKSAGRLALIGCGIYESQNSLFVEAKEWSSDAKALVAEISGIGIDYIVFEITEGNFEDLALTDAMPGSTMVSERNVRSSLGCGVYYEVVGLSEGEGDYGFITTAHGGIEEGDDMDINGYSAGFVDFVNLGIVYDNLQAYNDVAVIYRGSKPDNSRYDATFTLNTFDGKIVLNTGKAVEGEAVCLIGSTSGKKTGEVMSANYTVDWNGEGPGIYRFMVKTDISSSGGDSGGPLLRDNKNNSYTLLGILKGREHDDNKAIFTSWDNIEKRLRYHGGRDIDIWLWP